MKLETLRQQFVDLRVVQAQNLMPISRIVFGHTGAGRTCGVLMSVA